MITPLESVPELAEGQLKNFWLPAFGGLYMTFFLRQAVQNPIITSKNPTPTRKTIWPVWLDIILDSLDNLLRCLSICLTERLQSPANSCLVRGLSKQVRISWRTASPFLWLGHTSGLKFMALRPAYWQTDGFIITLLIIDYPSSIASDWDHYQSIKPSSDRMAVTGLFSLSICWIKPNFFLGI